MNMVCILLSAWDSIAAFLNSNFTAALSGAFAGALAAQTIASRSKVRESLQLEIRSTNAAIMVAFTICNAGLTLKKQLVKGIYDRYSAKRAEFQIFKLRRSRGELPGVFEAQLDLRTVQMPIVPIDVMRSLMYEKISLTGRPLATMAALAGSTGTLAEVLAKRSELIERFRSIGETHPDLVAMYLGEPYGAGHVSEEFPDSVEAMHSLTDDVIFFSNLLIEDLTAHGEKVLAEYKKTNKKASERISQIDLRPAREAGLMPPQDNYLDWLKGFQNAPQPAAPADTLSSLRSAGRR